MDSRTLTQEQAEAVLAVLVAECGVEPEQPGWFAASRLGFSEHEFTADHEDAGPEGIALTIKALGLWVYTTRGVALPTGLEGGVRTARKLLRKLSEEFGPCVLEEQRLPMPGALFRPSVLAEPASA